VPLYTIATQAGTLGAADKAGLAAKLTEMHCQISGVPENWVHVVFQDYPTGSGFTAGKPGAAVALTLVIRTGRSAEYKRGLLQRLLRLLQDATGAPNDQIVIGMQEVPPARRWRWVRSCRRSGRDEGTRAAAASGRPSGTEEHTILYSRPRELRFMN
jgi:phenylpyruvate tautomerase PptA (4-oxalocrotonate tautomerase family)